MFKNSLTLAALLSVAAHADPVVDAPLTQLVEQTAPAEPTKPEEKPKDEGKPDPKAKKAEKAAKQAAAKAEKAKKATKMDHGDHETAESPTESKPKTEEMSTAVQKADKEQSELAIFNALAAEKHKQETNDLRAEVAKLKLEKELFDTQLATKSLQASVKDTEELIKFEAEKARASRKAELAKIQLEDLTAQLKSLQIKATLATTELEGEIQAIETRKKRDAYADAQPKYLDDPLQADGTLVISDRRIPFNGPVTASLADAVTERINYYNNKDSKKPIFIVIDDSPGGSVMAGYRILKAMEGSEAPVYVVVKSFAASMAACITTLAERSFAYPNAIILHHQISQTYAFSQLNLTDQKEAYEDLKKWWNRLADPIARKMGITSDEFIEMMYDKTVSGDWTEFGDDAVKLKWVDHVIARAQETSLLKDPAAPKSSSETPSRSSLLGGDDLIPSIDEKGNKFMLLPRRNPKDVYLMFNPDGYYRFK